MAERFRRRFRVSALILCTHLCTQYLVGAPLAQIPASVRCGMEAISLWHCWGTIEPSARLDCWIDCFSSFSWKYPIDCIDFGLDKTQWTNTSRRHGTPNHHRLRKPHTGLQAAWILCLSSLPPDLDFQMKSKIYFYLKRGLWTTEQQSSSFSPCFWRCFCFRSVLVALFLKISEHGDSWCTNSSFSSLLVKLSQVFESALLDSILKLAVIPVACAHFPTQFLPSSQLCI